MSPKVFSIYAVIHDTGIGHVMRKLNGITINGEYLGNSVVINGMFRAICTISPVIMRDFVTIINKIERLEDAVKINNFNCGFDSIDIEFGNTSSKGMASLYFKLLNGEPELTNCKLIIDGKEYSTFQDKIVLNSQVTNSNKPQIGEETERQRRIRELKERKLEQQKQAIELKKQKLEELKRQKMEELKKRSASASTPVMNKTTPAIDPAKAKNDKRQELLQEKLQALQRAKAARAAAASAGSVNAEKSSEMSAPQSAVAKSDNALLSSISQTPVSEINSSKTPDTVNSAQIANAEQASSLNAPQSEILTETRAAEDKNAELKSTAEDKSADINAVDNTEANSSVSNLSKQSDIENKSETVDDSADTLTEINNDISDTDEDIQNVNNVDDESDIQNQDVYGADEYSDATQYTDTDFNNDSLDSANFSEDEFADLTDEELAALEAEADAELNSMFGSSDDLSSEEVMLDAELNKLMSNDTQSSGGFGGSYSDLAEGLSQGLIQGLSQGLSEGLSKGLSEGLGALFGNGSGFNPNAKGSGIPMDAQTGVDYGQIDDINNDAAMSARDSYSYDENSDLDGLSDLYSEFYSENEPEHEVIEEEVVKPVNVAEGQPTSEVDALKAELEALKAEVEPQQELMTLDEFMEKQKELADAKEKKRRKKLKIVGSRENVNASALEDGIFVSGNKVYKWGDVRVLDD